MGQIRTTNKPDAYYVKYHTRRIQRLRELRAKGNELVPFKRTSEAGAKSEIWY